MKGFFSFKGSFSFSFFSFFQQFFDNGSFLRGALKVFFPFQFFLQTDCQKFFLCFSRVLLFFGEGVERNKRVEERVFFAFFQMFILQSFSCFFL